MKETRPARWIALDAATFDADQKVVRDGVEFHVFLSPYDLPEAVRGYYDEALARFVIEFRYVTDEDSVDVPADQHVTLQVGAHSRRLRRLLVDVKGAGVKQVALRIEQAIDRLPTFIRADRVPRDNFQVAKSVLHSKEPELLAQLASP